MNTYEFEIVLAGNVELTEAPLDRIFESGCDDSNPRTQHGVTTIGFYREAESLNAAVTSALDTMRELGFEVDHVETAEFREIERLNQSLRQPA